MEYLHSIFLNLEDNVPLLSMFCAVSCFAKICWNILVGIPQYSIVFRSFPVIPGLSTQLENTGLHADAPKDRQRCATFLFPVSTLTYEPNRLHFVFKVCGACFGMSQDNEYFAFRQILSSPAVLMKTRVAVTRFPWKGRLD